MPFGFDVLDETGGAGFGVPIGTIRTFPPAGCTAPTVTKRVGKVVYEVNGEGLTVTAEGTIDGPHPGRAKGRRPEPVGGRAPGDHRGHLVPEGAVDDTATVNVKENIISESGASNLGPKKQLDNLLSRIKCDNPGAVVRLRAEALRKPGETRPFAITYYITVDGQLTRAVTILND